MTRRCTSLQLPQKPPQTTSSRKRQSSTNSSTGPVFLHSLSHYDLLLDSASDKLSSLTFHFSTTWQSWNRESLFCQFNHPTILQRFPSTDSSNKPRVLCATSEQNVRRNTAHETQLCLALFFITMMFILFGIVKLKLFESLQRPLVFNIAGGLY